MSGFRGRDSPWYIERTSEKVCTVASAFGGGAHQSTYDVVSIAEPTTHSSSWYTASPFEEPD